jgi:GTP cyclohydrolase II
MTNNPSKIEGLRALGVTVTGRVPHVIPANDINRSYLETKALRSGHLIDVVGREHLPEQSDPAWIEGEECPVALEAQDPVESST